MSRYPIAACLAMCLLAPTASANVVLTITTDNDLSDGDDFSFPFDGAFHTLYIWGRSEPTVETIDDFNFDLDPSGGALSFANASIGALFTNANWLTDIDLDDLQFGASKYIYDPLDITVDPHTLFATIDVAVPSESIPGPDTTIDLAGGDFTMIGAAGVSGTSRVLPEPSTLLLLAVGLTLAYRRPGPEVRRKR